MKTSLRLSLVTLPRLFPILLSLVGWLCLAGSVEAKVQSSPASFPLPIEAYSEAESTLAGQLGREPSLWEKLATRARMDPFNIVATAIFFAAILHTFLCSFFNRLAHRFEERHRAALHAAGRDYPPGREPVSFGATLFHFLGEVEAVFGIWMIPLLLCTLVTPGHGWNDAVAYLDSRNFTEPIFVVVIMAIASTRPVVLFATASLRGVAALGRGTPVAWWLSILTIAPLLGSFITEPAAMTIAAMLLGVQFYQLNPSPRLRYATLGLLFVNISVGGTLTHFAAPPVLMVATEWHWSLPFMFTHFGWRAILGIVLSNAIYLAFFWKDLQALRPQPASPAKEEAEEPVPAWVTGVHLAFLAWTVVTLHHPAFFVVAFLFFLAFTHATRHHQYEMALRGPVLVGFFLAGLVVHGGLQGWWISPILGSLNEGALFLVATVLTAFNDNASITYLAAQVPAFSPDVLVAGNLMTKEGAELIRAHALEYAVVAGAVTGGGLTVIANAPNPAGQSLLARYFGPDGVSPLGLLAAAILPTLIMAACFMLLPH